MSALILFGACALSAGVLTELLILPIYFLIFQPFEELDWHEGFCSDLFDKECVGDLNTDDFEGFSCFWQSTLYEDRDQQHKLGNARFCSGDEYDECYKSTAAAQRDGGDPRPYPYQVLVDGKDEFPPAWLCSYDSLLTSTPTSTSTLAPTLFPTIGPTHQPTFSPTVAAGLPTPAPTKAPGPKKCLYLHKDDVSFDIGNKDYVARFKNDDWKEIEESPSYQAVLGFMYAVGPLLIISGAGALLYAYLYPPFKPELAEGSRMEIEYGRGDYRVCSIQRANRDGTYDIIFDNDDRVEHSVPRIRIQEIGFHEQQANTSAAAPSASNDSSDDHITNRNMLFNRNSNTTTTYQATTAAAPSAPIAEASYSTAFAASPVTIEMSSITVLTFEVGSIVEGNYAEAGIWSTATVVKVENGFYDLKYEDGRQESHVPLRNVRYLAARATPLQL